MSGAGILWLFLPVLGSFLAHAPVLKLDLFPRWKRPMDFGATFRGRRVLGENKTWRGALVMFVGVLASAVLLGHIDAYWSRLPGPIRAAGPWTFGALVAAGTVCAELPNSFFKRQLDIGPGAQRRSSAGVLISILDQGDFVIGIWLFLTPIWVIPPAQAAVAFAAVAAVHMVINVIGYALGIRRSWL